MKIVIVGGGTAGWLAAATFIVSDVRRKKEGLPAKLDITVLESDNIPIIGAGEGSTGIFSSFITKKLEPLGINEIDFLYKTDATLKLGIKFKDWKTLNHTYLSPIQPTNTTMMNIDMELLGCYVYGNYHDSTPAGYLMDRGYSCYKSGKGLIPINAYHFDAHEVGKYFKEICLKHGVKNVKGTINQLNLNKESGFLNSVNIKESEEKIEGDFWIDASGFARILTNNMDSGWTSYKEHLPTNSAIPYLYPHDDNVLPETLAWAQPNGWMWQIPTQERYGCGYVYSDAFTTYDKALDELMKNTGRKIEPIRNIKFDVGRINKFWNKNILSIGLSSGFLEPLQATSIHSTIIQLDIFAYHFFQADIERIDFSTSPSIYNNTIIKMWDDFRDLLQIHYMTEREDTEFWKYCKNELPKTDKVKHILEVCKKRAPSSWDFDVYHGAATWGVWCWTILGLELVSKDIAQKTLENYALTRAAEEANRQIQFQGKSQLFSYLSNKDFLYKLKKKKL